MTKAEQSEIIKYLAEKDQWTKGDIISLVAIVVSVIMAIIWFAVRSNGKRTDEKIKSNKDIADTQIKSIIDTTKTEMRAISSIHEKGTETLVKSNEMHIEELMAVKGRQDKITEDFTREMFKSGEERTKILIRLEKHDGKIRNHNSRISKLEKDNEKGS